MCRNILHFNWEKCLTSHSVLYNYVPITESEPEWSQTIIKEGIVIRYLYVWLQLILMIYWLPFSVLIKKRITILYFSHLIIISSCNKMVSELKWSQTIHFLLTFNNLYYSIIHYNSIVFYVIHFFSNLYFNYHSLLLVE